MGEIYIDALKALAEPNRLRLFWLLVHIDERICVAEAMDVLGESQYNVSRNLKTLHQAKLLKQQKEGKWVFYSLVRQEQMHLVRLVESVKELPKEGFINEINRCKHRLLMREDNRCTIGAGSDEWVKVFPS